MGPFPGRPNTITGVLMLGKEGSRKVQDVMMKVEVKVMNRNIGIL